MDLSLHVSAVRLWIQTDERTNIKVKAGTLRGQTLILSDLSSHEPVIFSEYEPEDDLWSLSVSFICYCLLFSNSE